MKFEKYGILYVEVCRIEFYLMNQYFKKQHLLVLVCFSFMLVSKAQVKPVQIKSFTYSGCIMIGSDEKPLYHKVETDVRICDRFDLKVSQGLFADTYGYYHEASINNKFVSKTGLTQSLALNVAPVVLNRFKVNMGLGLVHLYLKQFQTAMQKNLPVTVDGEVVSYPFQYFDVDQSSRLGIDFYLDLEYAISDHFGLSVSANAMNFKTPVFYSNGFISSGFNVVYYIEKQFKQ